MKLSHISKIEIFQQHNGTQFITVTKRYLPEDGGGEYQFTKEIPGTNMYLGLDKAKDMITRLPDGNPLKKN